MEHILPNMECHSQWNRNDSVKYYTGSIHGLDIQWALLTDIHLVLFQGKTNRQTDKQTIWSWWFIDYQEAHRACVASVFWSASLLARQQAAGSHQDIHLILQNLHTVKKKWRGDSRGCSLFYLIYKHCSSLSQWLILRALSPCWWLVERPVQQQNLAFSAGPPINSFVLSQQKWHLSYLNAFFDWMVINMCRYTCRLSGASWGAEEWDYLIIMTASIMNGDRWLVLTSDPAGNYWTRTKSLIMNLLKPVGLLSWLQLRHI